MSWFGGSQSANVEKETFPVESSDGAAKQFSKNNQDQEDYLAMVYGDFLHSDDPRIKFNKKVFGILALQTVGTFALAVLCAKFGLFNNLSANVLTFAAAAFATIGGLTMLIINQDNRHTLPKAHFFLAGFVIGSAFLFVCLTQNFSDQFVLLFLLAVATGVSSLFLALIFAKDRAEADWYMQIAGAAGGAITTLMVPFYLNAWYGEDYSMMWVGWTVIFQVLFTYYIYYDITQYQGDSLVEEDDYIMSAIKVYYDWAFIVFFAVLGWCWNKTTSSE